MNICVFASGGGSNFKALIDAQNKNVFTSQIKLLITNNSNCGAVSIAKENNVPYVHISRVIYPEHSETEYAGIFLKYLKEYEIDLIILAGYMKKIESEILKEYKNKIINIHPALLPKFGGKGMYGMNVHKAVIEAGENVSGITIHIVNEEYDSGDILLQKEVSIDQDEDESSLQKKVLELEHKWYSIVIKNFEEGKYII